MKKTKAMLLKTRDVTMSNRLHSCYYIAHCKETIKYRGVEQNLPFKATISHSLTLFLSSAGDSNETYYTLLSHAPQSLLHTEL